MVLNKFKWNLISRLRSNSFSHGSHGPGITHTKIPSHIEWQTGDIECRDAYNGDWSYGVPHAPTFFVDETLDIIEQGNPFGPGPAYYVMLESPAIIDDRATSDVLRENIDLLNERCNLIFTYDSKLLHDKTIDTSRMRFMPAMCSWIKDTTQVPKTKLISTIMSGLDQVPGHQYRLQLLDIAIRNNPNINIIRGGHSYHVPVLHKEDLLQEYMFSIAAENIKYPGYFTEKILDCFACRAVPIYLGAPDIGDFFNIDGILDFERLARGEQEISEDLYYSMTDAIEDNYERVMKYMCWEDLLWDKYFS